MCPFLSIQLLATIPEPDSSKPFTMEPRPGISALQQNGQFSHWHCVAIRRIPLNALEPCTTAALSAVSFLYYKYFCNTSSSKRYYYSNTSYKSYSPKHRHQTKRYRRNLNNTYRKSFWVSMLAGWFSGRFGVFPEEYKYYEGPIGELDIDALNPQKN